MEAARVLVVEDEDVIRHVLSSYLKSVGCQVSGAASGEEALKHLENPDFGVALVDLVLPGMHGLQVLEAIKRTSPDTEVILMTSHASVDTAAQAIRSGAYDYLLKPFQELDEVGETVTRALEKRDLTLKNRALLEDLAARNQALSAAIQRRDTLNEAGRAMSTLASVSGLLDYLLGLVVEELQVDRASLMLLDETSNELYIACARGIPTDVIAGTRVKLGSGIAGRVAETREPLIVNDVQGCPDILEHPRPDLSRSFVSAPMVVSVPIASASRVLGVINLTNRKVQDGFTSEDVHFLQSLAGQAAVAIERGRYVEELQEAVTRLEVTQKQLISAERLKALGEMAAGVAHDFNNVLNGILLRSERMLSKLLDPLTDARSFHAELQVIARLALQGSQSVRSLQDFTRIRKDRPQIPVDLNEVVREAVDLTRHYWKERNEAIGIEVDVRVELGATRAVRGVHTELTQVVSNLIFNATEAMPNGGEIVIRTRAEEEECVLEVLDTGVGMSREVQDRVFEPFFTTKEKGQGLGSSIIYGIVTRHGGKIRIDSEPGQGTRFVIRFPVDPTSSDQSPAAPRPQRRLSAAVRARKRILVVDDDEVNVEAHRCILEDEGYVVSTASSGEEALQVFAARPFDVVVTDLGMPGMCGWDVAKAARAMHPGARIILLSGWGVQEDQHEALEAGIDVVLSKPCPLADLLASVDMVLSDPEVEAPFPSESNVGATGGAGARQAGEGATGPREAGDRT